MKERKMSKLKVGDFVKHKENKNIILQIVQILGNVEKDDSRMINCIRVTDIHSYLETDMRGYELTDKDRDKILDNSI
jgi:hypothetical protein